MATKKPAANDTTEVIEPGRVKRLIVQNFRSIGIHPVTIDLNDIVVLVGPNNVGKSSILKAYETIMQDGSKAAELFKEDFPNEKYGNDSTPTIIELHTIATKFPPSSKWVSIEEGENVIKERWIWKEPGAPKREGWDAILNTWSDSFPWGPANVAKPKRPQIHWVRSFDSPNTQAEKINKLITEMISEKAMNLPDEDGATREDGSPKTQFEVLLEKVQSFQRRAFDLAKTDVKRIEKKLTDLVANVFARHVVEFSLHPPVDKDLKPFSNGSDLTLGYEDGYKSPLKNQGSGAQRTVLWSVLKILSEQSIKTADRPKVLLIGEPELCLHPSAIRDACRVLYDLAKKAGWQIIVTTHSPVFIDLGQDNTTVIRVERSTIGEVYGTTLYRPQEAKLSDDDKQNLQLLNIYDPYVAEFFFGGRVIVVEGDTEYSAFRYVMSETAAGHITGISPVFFENIHVVRARGKATVASLCKILNHFGTKYSVLHDTDEPEITLKSGKTQKNSAWTQNQKILEVVMQAPDPTKIRLLASKINFEHAFLETEVTKDNPYNAVKTLKQNKQSLIGVVNLLSALTDHLAPIPEGAVDAKNLKEEDIKVAA